MVSDQMETTEGKKITTSLRIKKDALEPVTMEIGFSFPHGPVERESNVTDVLSYDGLNFQTSKKPGKWFWKR